MVGGGRRRGRLVDAEETSDEKPSKQKATASSAVKQSGQVGLGVMDPGPGDALVSLTASSDRRPPNRINKQALASRYACLFSLESSTLSINVLSWMF